MKSTFFEELPARKNPQFQPGSPNSAAEGPKGANPKGGTDQEASAKRIRQAVYDIRYRARREELELEAAYNQYIGNTSMTAPEKAAVREKLFGESFDMLGEAKKNKAKEQEYVVRVKDRAAGTQYWRKATRKKITQLRSNPNIGGQGVEMSTYKKPYEEGEQKKKSGKGKVNTNKSVTEAKKGDGNLANNYPPYDKVTRGDVIAGALGKDQMGGKKKKKGVKEEWETILSDPMLRLVSDYELESLIYDVFEEIEAEGYLTEALELIDSDSFLAEERDAGAMAKGRLDRKRMGATADGPQTGGAAGRFVAKKAKQAVKSGADRVGGAVKKVAGAIKSAGSVAKAKAQSAVSGAKSAVKSAGKSAVGAASKAAGHAVGSYQGARDKARAAASKSEPPKAASTDTSKSGTTAGSASVKSSSSSSGGSDSGSSSGGEKKAGFLRRLGGAMKRNLKKAAGKTLRGISSATDKGAKKLGEETTLKVKVKSEMFDWRSEFFEGLEDNLAPEDEEKINVKKGIKNKVTINPKLDEQKKLDIDNRIEEAKLKVKLNNIESQVEIDPLKYAVEKAVQERFVRTLPQKDNVSDVVASLNRRIADMREAAEDRMRDQRQERGGVAGNVDYNRPPAKKLSNAELGIKPGKTPVQKAAEKQGKTALDIVKSQIRAKHGDSALMK